MRLWPLTFATLALALGVVLAFVSLAKPRAPGDLAAACQKQLDAVSLKTCKEWGQK